MSHSPMRSSNRLYLFAIVFLVVSVMLYMAWEQVAPATAQEDDEERPGLLQRINRFVGGLEEVDEEEPVTEEVEPEAVEPVPPRAVRNDVAQAGEEIVTLRHWKVQKGVFPKFYEESEQGVWPYFEKIGARVVGMWQVIHPPDTDLTESPDYDEVYLMTRYASVAHWKATRKTTLHGGNGPDWDRCKAALDYRRSVTIETNLQFLKGNKWDNAPWFLPGLDEEYEVVQP